MQQRIVLGRKFDNLWKQQLLRRRTAILEIAQRPLVQNSFVCDMLIDHDQAVFDL